MNSLPKIFFKAIEYARNIDEETGSPILDKFKTDQPAFAQMMFSILPTLIAEQDQGMGHLFMDLCFDVTCIYQHAFGNMPTQDELGPGRIEKHFHLWMLDCSHSFQKRK